jgi:uncharacterized repeat protein (TIGR03803 family)
MAVLGAFSVAACGGQSSSIPVSGLRAPTYATRAVESQPISLLTGGVPDQPQETVLYSFTGRSDGGNPSGGLINVDGVLYGTTESGGANFRGTVFKIATSGAETVLYSFGFEPDGENPHAGLTDIDGVLYGTTEVGGRGCRGLGCGTVFAITTSGTERVLHRFAGGTDGSIPLAGLTAIDGVLYGTTETGGANDYGTVFRVTRSGEETVLHSFGAGSDGKYPSADLTNVNGVIYGTTGQGGANNHGTVFSLTTSGAESVLHSFAGGNDGAVPGSKLTNVNGVLYGTTEEGGAFGRLGDGTVYKITTSGTEKVIHGFGGGNDGKFPIGDLTNVNGVLYGATAEGGSQSCPRGCGTVFKITPFAVKNAVYSFAGGNDGVSPNGSLTYVNGLFYGTTADGGTDTGGTVFSLSL